MLSFTTGYLGTKCKSGTHLRSVVIDVFDPDGQPHLRLSPIRSSPITCSYLQFVNTFVSLVVDQTSRLDHSGQMIDVKRYFLRIDIRDAVADVGILSRVSITSGHSQHPTARGLIFIKINCFLILVKCRIIVVDIQDGDPHPGTGLLPAAHVGLVHGADGEGVAGLVLGVQDLGHVQHPRHGVDPELLVPVARHDLEQHLRVTSRVLVTDLQ